MAQTIEVLQWHIDNGERYEDHRYWELPRFYATKEEAIEDLPKCLDETYIGASDIEDFTERQPWCQNQVAAYDIKTPEERGCSSRIADRDAYIALQKVTLFIPDTVKQQLED